jgi:putative ABC transport system permease protein
VQVAVGGVRSFTSGHHRPRQRAGSSPSATIAAFDPVTAQRCSLARSFDSIDIAVADGAADDVAATVRLLLPARRGRTREQVARESAERIGNAVDLLRWVLLGFALIALFVGAFLIDNTFRIIVGQRIRELALLRAIGASGAQVRAMILGESLAISIVATALGLAGGVGVAEALTRVFNAGGVGFPSADTIVAPRTVLVGALVGVGVTMVATLAPAIHAGRVPPVAAMHLESVQGRRGSRTRSVPAASSCWWA